MKSTREICEENERRNILYFRDYSRIYGDPSSEVLKRIPIKIEDRIYYLPESFFKVPIVKALQKYDSFELVQAILNNKGHKYSVEELKHLFVSARFIHDFEYWAYVTIKIQDKRTKKFIKFALNRGQRRLLSILESMRLNNVPIRVILVKARQWGGSTLTQIYMLWLQMFHYVNWHSVIISQFKTQSANIRNMIQKTIKRYPSEYSPPTLKTLPGTQSVKYIVERGCEIITGSAENPDAIRSFDIAMAHLSEVGLWQETLTKSGSELAQALYAAIPDEPGTLIVMESTAKGIGNFFHEQYNSATNGDSELQPLFVSWCEIDLYRRPIRNYEKFIKEELTDYNLWQIKQGATLEGIAWYNWYKKAKGYNDFQMKSEYPTTADEAFQTNAVKYFPDEYIEYAKSTVKNPIFIGDIEGNATDGAASLQNLILRENNTNKDNRLSIWEYPDNNKEYIITNRYVVVVDIGGTHYKSDNSFISVYDRASLMDPYGALEKVAEWHGHIDHDLLAWKAAQIATFYQDALLVIESNTIDSKDKKKSDNTIFEGDHFYTVINELSEVYNNLYARVSDPDKPLDNGMPKKYGWHTNKRTKYLAFDSYKGNLRDNTYIERSQFSTNEMKWLEQKADATIGAAPGKRDDSQICNAIANYVAFNEMEMPKLVLLNNKSSFKSKQNIGEASF